MRLFVDQLTNIDFSYLCPARGIVGETWLANIELTGELDQQGMVCDFGIVKKEVRQWLDDTLDHKLVVPTLSPSYSSTTQKDLLSLEFDCHAGKICSTSPLEAIAEINVPEINAQQVANWCEQQLKALFNNSIQKLKIEFSTEAIDGPYYHYTHGLKKHEGNCQRIAHGHRSKVLIWKNQQPCINSMRIWAQKWKDIYIGTKQDLCSARATEMHDSHYAFSYTAAQGEFYLSLPKKLCYVIDSDTTVELLAEHISKELKHQNPSDTFKVKAFEGAGKGAITES